MYDVAEIMQGNITINSLTLMAQRYRNDILLFFAGVNLIIIQYLMLREFSISLFSTELTILITIVSYFIGYSIGYRFSASGISLPIARAAAPFFLIHLSFPFAVKFAAGIMSTLHLSRLAVPSLFIIGSFTLSSFYAVFLPNCVAKTSPDKLPRYFSIELAGSIIGALFVIFFGCIDIKIVYLIYNIFFFIIIYMVGSSRKTLLALSMVLVIVSLFWSRLEKASSEFFYNHYYSWFKGAEVVNSTYSPYQKIEVIRDEGELFLYLNGLEYFNSDGLADFNLFLSAVPASLLGNDLKILIVGSGSLSSLSHVKPFAKEITIVEIDRKVAEIGMGYFKGFNRIDSIRNWNLVIDDAKHFLYNTAEYYDLIIIDVPAPYYIQTALLFTKEFYEIARKRLSDNGLLSVYLCESLEDNKVNSISKKILSSVMTVFDEIMVVSSGDIWNAFAFAGSQIKFSNSQVEERLQEYGLNKQCRIYKTGEIREIVNKSGSRPASMSDLNIVMELGIYSLF